MYKQFLFLLIIIFNINMFAQVVIKDEITLYETESPDEETLTMPFYGKITGNVNSGAIINNRIRKVMIEADGQIVVRQCICGAGCPFIQSSWIINGVPASTPVTVTVYSHCENGQFIGAETRLTDLGDNEFNIEAYNPNFQQWFNATTLKFTATTPPDCPNAADDCPSGFTEEMPELILEHQPPSFTSDEECEDNPNRLAFFSPGLRASESTNLFKNISTSDIEVCFDEQTQEWKFELTENITLNYIKTICADNITNPQTWNATLVYNIEQIQNMQTSECAKLLASIEAHKTYFGSGIQDGFVFTEILDSHETQHQNDWQSYINKYKNSYYNIPLEISNDCIDFIDDEDAKTQMLSSIKNLFFSEFWNPYKESFLLDEYLSPDDDATKEKHKQLEIKLHDRETVQKIIKAYEDAINNKCD